MNKRTWKSVVSVLLAMAMILSLSVPAFAGTSLNLVWPAVWSAETTEGVPPEWAVNADVDTQNATISAMNMELDRQRQLGFDMGEFKSFGGWGNMVIAQFEGGDNVGNPWNQPGRLMGAIIAPFPGIAFSVKGYFGKDLGSTPLSNQIEWLDPSTFQKQLYQVYTNGTIIYNTNGTKFANWGYYPGSGATASAANVFQQTYAYSAWMNEDLGKAVNLGVPHSDVKETESGILYQEFLGNDSNGATGETYRGWNKTFGISYIVMQNKTDDVAYIVTDKMLTAWASTWDYTNAADPDRFAVTGAPVGNQYRNKDGVLCQDFENCTVMLTDPTKPQEPTLSGAACGIESFTIGENFVYISEGMIDVYLTDEKADITALTPVFTISEGATCNQTSGKAMDFSEPVDFVVTAENGNESVYTVTVEKASETTDADVAVVDTFMSFFEFIHNPVSYEDGGYILGMTIAYDALSPKQKYLAKDALAEIEKLVAAYDALYSNPIKIAFIGDSITDPGVNAANYAVQVADELATSGMPFEVKNFGASGFCLSPKSDWKYNTTDKYKNSLSYNPDIVFLLLGTNDSKPRNWDNANVKATFKQDLIDMVNTYSALESKPLVVIGTSPTVREDYGKIDTIDNENVTEIAQIQREVAEEMNLPLIDINAYTKDQPTWFNTNDGVHPNTVGHTNMKEPYLDFLADLINTAASDITINGETIADFDPYTFAYTYSVSDIEQAKKLEVAATAESERATVTVDWNEDGAFYKIDIKGGLDHFALSYIIYLTDGMPGDVDGDGTVNVSDIIKVKNLIMEGTWTPAELTAGDMNNSGKLDVADIIAIKNMIMGA